MTKDEALKPDEYTIDYWEYKPAYNRCLRGVKITHHQTGIVVTEDSDRPQHINKAIAMEKLNRLLSAQPAPAIVQEPALIVKSNGCSQLSLTNADGSFFDMSKHIDQNFYTSAPAREWVGLSGDEVEAIALKKEFWYGFNNNKLDWRDYAEAIEQALKEKNK